jgi:hypothetical protein
VAALKAHAQVDPGVAGLQAFFAAFAAGLYVLHMVFNVGTGPLRHWNPLGF